MSYVIIMKFLSWVFAIMLLSGYTFIKSCERDLNDENSPYNDLLRMNMQIIIDEFNNRKWAGRVMYTLFWGAKMMAVPFLIFKKGEDDDE